MFRGHPGPVPLVLVFDLDLLLDVVVVEHGAPRPRPRPRRETSLHTPHLGPQVVLKTSLRPHLGRPRRSEIVTPMSIENRRSTFNSPRTSRVTRDLADDDCPAQSPSHDAWSVEFHSTWGRRTPLRRASLPLAPERYASVTPTHPFPSNTLSAIELPKHGRQGGSLAAPTTDPRITFPIIRSALLRSTWR